MAYDESNGHMTDDVNRYSAVRQYSRLS